MMTSRAPQSFARFFRRIPHPIPRSFPRVDPKLWLLEWYNDFYSRPCVNANQTPAVWMTPIKNISHAIQEFDATLYTAFRRPYRHILYKATEPYIPDDPSKILVRQWIYMRPDKGKLSVVTFMESCDHKDSLPTDEWNRYWNAISDRRSEPPLQFWRSGSPPLALCQDVTGKIHWPYIQKESKKLA